MELNEIAYTSATPIDGYGPGFFRVGGQALEGAVCLTAEKSFSWGGFDGISIIEKLGEAIDVLLVGTGETMDIVPKDFRVALEEAGIGLEPMASPSACRTFNVLLAEGRRVAAALLPV